MNLLNKNDFVKEFKETSTKDTLKRVRNDFLLNRYLRKGSTFNTHQLNIQDNVLTICIAFNRPDVIDLLIENFLKNVINGILLIADNSSKGNRRIQLKALCKARGIAYVSLPMNKTKHANRSHSMAMQWCYEHIIKPAQPGYFGFIDHDLIPLEPTNLIDKIGAQTFYGARWISDKTKAWQLWAGYCFFNYKQTKKINLNFMYDFPAGLDTGGRNYKLLYQHYNPEKLILAPDQILTGIISSEESHLHRIDKSWLHLGGAGYRENFDDSFSNISTTLSFLENYPLSELEDHSFNLSNRH